MKTLLLIVNPKAGRARTGTALYDAIARFSQAGYLVRLFITTQAGDARQVAAECAAQYDLVVCVGGDGTLNETISGLLTSPHPSPLGYLPYGSTNDFASSLHLSSVPATAASAIALERPFALDIGQHNDRYFSYVASFGAFTKASYSAPQPVKNTIGHMAYILEGVASLDSLHSYRGRVETEDEVFEGDFIFGAVCNSTSLGGLVKLDPKKVRMDDGQFELILLKMPKSPAELQKLISGLTRMDYEAPGIIFRHIREATFTTDSNIPWSLDGEYAPSASVIHVRNLPGAITLYK